MSTLKEQRNTADEIAQKKFNTENYESFKNQVIADYESGSLVSKNKAADNMSAYAQDLALILAEQKILEMSNISEITKFSNLFNDGWITEGNERQYLKTIATGHTSFTVLKDKFVPDKKTHGKSEGVRIGFYDMDAAGNITLRPATEMFAKELTVDMPNWYGYFKNGNLRAYMDQQISQIRETWELKKFDKVATYITQEADNFKKQIAGSGVDMFSSLIEVIEHLGRMQKLNNEYMIGANTKAISECKLSDLVIIMHEDIVNTLRTGVKTQLFNEKLLNIKNVLNDENITTLPNKLKWGGPEDAPEITGDPYVDKNTIIVFDKRAFRLISQLDKMGVQNYTTNMTTQYTTHIWVTMGTLPWYQGFKYINPNLSKLPSDPVNP